MCNELEWWEAVPSAWEVREELPIPARLGVSVVGLAGYLVPGRAAWRSRHAEPLMLGSVALLCTAHLLSGLGEANCRSPGCSCKSTWCQVGSRDPHEQV